MEDFRPTAGQAAEAGILHFDEDVADAPLREMAEPVDLHWRPGLQMQARVGVMEQANHIQIPVVVSLMVEAADDVHLR